MKAPKLTVLMPVYNTASFLKEAIESILNQTFGDFEFLIFNDGSSDNSAEIIKGFRDARIIFFDYKENSGYIVHLNKGIKIARGEYIARMDSDEISLPQRLEKQIEFLEKNPEYGVCGTQVETIDSTAIYVSSLPVEDKKIRSWLFFHNAISHPTVVMRRAVLEKNNLLYDKEFYSAEDYKMWVDISRYSKLSNISEVLHKSRIRPGQVSQVYFDIQRAKVMKLYRQMLQDMGIEHSEEELEIHNSLCNNLARRTLSWAKRVSRWLLKLRRTNRERGLFPEPAFSQVIDERWFYFCLRERRPIIWAWERFIGWPLLNWSIDR